MPNSDDEIFFNLVTGRLELESAKQPQQHEGIVGRVASFDSFHKFGFIAVGDSRQGTIFVHLNNVIDGVLHVSDVVEFDLRDSRKYHGKIEAVNVRIMKADS